MNVIYRFNWCYRRITKCAITVRQPTAQPPLAPLCPSMKIESGPFIYTSRQPPMPLTEAEEAALAFAACGVTGYALADLAYGKGQGGQMLAGLLGRTVASPDAINTVSVIVTNDVDVEFYAKFYRPEALSPIHQAQ